MPVVMRTMFAVVVLFAAWSAQAQTAAEFFKGRTVNLQVGFGPGGANDAWARLVARFMQKHWPGNPNIVVQYQPGAGGLALMNQLGAIAPNDGTVFGLVNRGIPLEPLLGGQGIQFDPRRMTWIGSPDKDITVCAALTDAPVKTMQDIFTTELVVGATGSGADTAIYPEFLSALLGMKFKIVKGYKGSNEIILAMERGEVQGICVANDSLQRQALAKAGRVRLLFQAALAPDPRLKDIPVGVDLARTDSERQALQLFFARVSLGRPFVAPPGMSAERTKVLRDAFTATMADKEFIEEAAKQGLSVDPITGDELAGLIDAAYKTPANVVQATIKALGR
jgi:tripartite-type tricarboxylate transporter receptor subunit TctC